MSKYQGSWYRSLPAALNLTTPASKFRRRSSSLARLAAALMELGVLPAACVTLSSNGLALREASHFKISLYPSSRIGMISSGDQQDQQDGLVGFKKRDCPDNRPAAHSASQCRFWCWRKNPVTTQQVSFHS